MTDEPVGLVGTIFSKGGGVFRRGRRGGTVCEEKQHPGRGEAGAEERRRVLGVGSFLLLEQGPLYDGVRA